MRTCNKVQILPDSAMHLRGFVFLVACIALMGSVIAARQYQN